ncbi:MAG: GGDEF domain-containing protein [Oleiphilaceae bacterium]|nr:GGDEF domain-containing protein [Oleiphilaceae bacterium]
MAQMGNIFLFSRSARISCLALVALALYATAASNWLASAVAITAAAAIWSTPAGRPAHNEPLWRKINSALVVLLAAELCASLWLAPEGLDQWLFVIPLAAFATLPLPLASLVTLGCLIAVMLAGLTAGLGADRHQLVSTLLLTTALSCAIVFLREFKFRQLAPLRRTDELTQAASREYLSADLHREIQRSEREGTQMAIAMIGLDRHLTDIDLDADINAILPRIGRFLHSQLRDFDSYYRMADLQFLIILPGNSTAQATVEIDQIRQGLRDLLQSHGLHLTVSAGIAGLNIGDDANSLQRAAARTLQRAQRRGGNQVQPHGSMTDQSQKPGAPAMPHLGEHSEGSSNR